MFEKAFFIEILNRLHISLYICRQDLAFDANTSCRQLIFKIVIGYIVSSSNPIKQFI